MVQTRPGLQASRIGAVPEGPRQARALDRMPWRLALRVILALSLLLWVVILAGGSWMIG